MRGLPRVSVVMPVRNAASSVARAIASVQEQTLADWELVVVDDGSTDGSTQIVSSLAAQDSRIRLMCLAQSGIVASLCVGCEGATCRLIARMDADDLMDPRRLEMQEAFLEQQADIGLVSCRVRHGGDAREQEGYAHHVDWLNTLVTAQEISLRRFVEAPVAHPSVMFRRELLDRFGGYRAGDFPEDYELWLRWLDAGVRFVKVDSELLTWNDSEGRLSRVDERYSVDAFYKVKCDYLARWLLRRVDSRRVWLWGAGRITRKRFVALERHGVPIHGFIDVDVAKVGRLRDGRQVVSADDLPPRDGSFIIAGVGVRGARELIAERLRADGRVEGEDFILAA